MVVNIQTATQQLSSKQFGKKLNELYQQVVSSEDMGKEEYQWENVEPHNVDEEYANWNLEKKSYVL